jgi:23S rRNA pseudouridine1911/1915/1917 synthase
MSKQDSGPEIVEVHETVAPEQAGERLDAFLAARLADRGLSRARVQDWIRAGKAALDGASCKASERLRAGQRVDLRAELPAGELEAVPGELDVLHADQEILVLNKPPGLTVHPAPGEKDATLVHRLLHEYPGLRRLDAERPGIVHRIDKDTSGLILVALTEKSRLVLAGSFARREVDKAYLAVVHGAPSRKSDEIRLPIGRDPSHRTRMAVAAKGGREALTAYETLWTSPEERFSLLALRIATGRTHQIRVHLAHLGLPIAGDMVYGPRENSEWAAESGGACPAARHMLHAWKLGFRHPESGEAMRFGVRPPEDFSALLLELAHRPLRIGVTGLPGSGKSSLSKRLAGAGIPVFSADEAVARLYEPGGDGAGLIARQFGGRFTAGDGSVDKKALFDAMIESPALRREVEDAVHPMVRHDMEEFFREHGSEKIVAAEVPLLLEAGWKDGELDLVVCVDAPDEARRRRLAASRGLDEERAAAMESWQWRREDKLAASDLIVENRDGLERLDQEAARLVERLREEAARRAEALREEIAALTDPESDA